MPKLLIVYAGYSIASPNNLGGFLSTPIIFAGSEALNNSVPTGYFTAQQYVKFTNWNTTISWYNTEFSGDRATGQLNASGTVYNFKAFG